MRIWMVVQNAVSPAEAGFTRHYTFARELVQRGHDVSIITASFNHSTHQETRLQRGERYRLEQIDGVGFLWLRSPMYAGNTLKRIWNILEFTRKIWQGVGLKGLGRPDVIIGSSPQLITALAAERLAHRLKTPFVLEVRDLWPQCLVDFGKVSPGHPLVRCLEQIERHLYRKAHKVIAVWPKMVEHMVQKGGVREETFWLPNGIDFDLVPAPTPPPDESTFTMMYAGAHGLANDVDTLIDAASLLQREGWGRRIKFRLVGHGPAKSRLQARVRSEGITNVRFDDPVAKRELFGILRTADGFIMHLRDSPLFRWGISPNKLYDYFACARPILFAVNSSHNPVAEAHAGITCAAQDPQAMARAIKHLAETPRAERQQMGLRGYQYGRSRHDMSMLAERLEVQLAEVCGDMATSSRNRRAA